MHHPDGALGRTKGKGDGSQKKEKMTKNGLSGGFHPLRGRGQVQRYLPGGTKRVREAEKNFTGRGRRKKELTPKRIGLG